jgi:hypothetical protein
MHLAVDAAATYWVFVWHAVAMNCVDAQHVACNTITAGVVSRLVSAWLSTGKQCRCCAPKHFALLLLHRLSQVVPGDQFKAAVPLPVASNDDAAVDATPPEYETPPDEVVQPGLKEYRLDRDGADWGANLVSTAAMQKPAAAAAATTCVQVLVV